MTGIGSIVSADLGQIAVQIAEWNEVIAPRAPVRATGPGSMATPYALICARIRVSGSVTKRESPAPGSGRAALASSYDRRVDVDLVRADHHRRGPTLVADDPQTSTGA